jgi:hypothetical protein
VVRVWSSFKTVSDSPALHSRWSVCGPLSKLCLTALPSIQGGPFVVLFQNCVWQPCPPFKVVRVWSPFKIVSDSPALHSRWSLLLKNGISLIYHIWFILSQINLKFILLYMTRSSSTYLHGFSIQNFCSVHLYLLCKLGLFW